MQASNPPFIARALHPAATDAAGLWCVVSRAYLLFGLCVCAHHSLCNSLDQKVPPIATVNPSGQPPANASANASANATQGGGADAAGFAFPATSSDDWAF